MHRLRSIVIASFIVFVGYAPGVSAQMHKCQTKDGRTSYQEEPCPADAKAGTVRKPTQPPGGAAAQPGGSAKRKPEEDKALGNLVVISSVQKDCQRLLGRHVSLDEMRKGCVGQGMSMQLARENDPGNDPAYDYRLSVGTGGFELSVSPRQPGLTGYYTDGRNLYENPSGAATARSRLLGPVPYF